MSKRIQRRAWFLGLLSAWLLCLPALAGAASSVTWHKAENRVDADVRDLPLGGLLEQIAAATGWQVYVEPGTKATSSSKFKNLAVSDALRRLLGDLNFALVPETNGTPRLLVFKTSIHEATQRIKPPAAKAAAPKPIADELIVRLKPGEKIDDLARKLGAKVIGRIDSLNAYLLKFDNADDASAARDALTSDPAVASVDSNYSIDLPPTPQGLAATSVPPLSLQVKAPGPNGRIVVGLVDTPIQSLGGGLDAFLLPAKSVAGGATPEAGAPTHATSMAETILSSIQSITGGSSSVQILPVDVYGNNASTTTFDVAVGVTTAVNAGANPINLSLGSPTDSPFLHDVISQASSQGVIFFAAAGNEPVTTPTYPAAYPEVTSVTAMNQQGQVAPYANRGDFVKIGAPGSSVVYYSGFPFMVTGTSVSSAFASGLAAGLAETTSKTLPAVQTALQNSPSLKPQLPAAPSGTTP